MVLLKSHTRHLVPLQKPNTQPLSVLDTEQTCLMQHLDLIFKNWGILNGAFSMTMPLLLPVKDLAMLDVYYNFPHQALLVASLNLEQGNHQTMAANIDHIHPSHLECVELGIPSAACYGVYLHYKGQVIPKTGILVTINGQCCRKEKQYEHLRRLMGFHMREIVALGPQSFTESHLTEFSEKIYSFAALLGLRLHKEVASDPFFEGEGSRALFQKLSPVKYEFLFEDIAIASINNHRTFFGERCQIKLSDSSNPIFTSCVAFGLERWLFALHRHYGNWHDPIEIIESLKWAA